MAPFVRNCINCVGRSAPVINIPSTTPTTTPLTTPCSPTIEPVPWWVEYNRPITITCETKPYECWL